MSICMCTSQEVHVPGAAWPSSSAPQTSRKMCVIRVAIGTGVAKGAREYLTGFCLGRRMSPLGLVVPGCVLGLPFDQTSIVLAEGHGWSGARPVEVGTGGGIDPTWASVVME